MALVGVAQTDKKYLGAKAMLQEIKDLVERRRAADSSLSAVSSSAPFATRLHPDLVYNYRDRSGPAACCCLPLSSSLGLNPVITGEPLHCGSNTCWE